MTTSTIGLVGLGQMGLPICKRLATSFDVLAVDIDARRRELASKEPRTRATPALAELAECECVVLSLPNPVASRSVLGELAPRLALDSLLIETSTVLPDHVRAAARELEGHGLRLIEAAVLSGVSQMERGAATLLVGGADSDVADAKDVLETLGPSGVRRFGALGSGMAAKVVNNGVAHAVMVVLVEAFAMAEAEGVDLGDVAAMLERPDGGLMRPLTHRVMERIAGGDFAGGMSLEAARKDSALALAMAQGAGVPLFATQAAHSAYDIAAAAGLGREDYSAIATLWQTWTGTSLTFGQDE